MAIYSYKGLDKTGKEIRSSINCESEVVAKQRVRSMGIMLIELKEQSAKNPSNKGITLFSSKKVKVTDLALMTRQLSTLVKAKIQIVEALQALVNQVDHEHLKVVLSEIRTKVNEGSSLAKALSEHPKVFDNVYVNMVEAGEASGTLDIVLNRLADFTESQVKLRNKIKGAMTYPIVMASFGFLMINIIFIKVIPQIAKMFESTKKELPIQTKVTIAISNFLQNYWYIALIAIFLSIYLIKKFLNSTAGKRLWHGWQLKLPVIGLLIRMINVSRFCSTLGTLLNSGVPILASMNIVKNLIPNIWMKEAVEESKIAISEGSSMTGPLVKSGLFPTMVTHMIKLGEQSGELEPMLNIIAENYQDQVDTKITGLTAILEPVMMIFMGGIVGLIVFSVIVPMMELNKVN